MPDKFYISLTWDNWPEGGSYGTTLWANDAEEAVASARWEMAANRAEERGLCWHCGEDTDDGEGWNGLCGDCADSGEDKVSSDEAVYKVLEELGDDWHVVDCFKVADFVREHS